MLVYIRNALHRPTASGPDRVAIIELDLCWFILPHFSRGRPLAYYGIAPSANSTCITPCLSPLLETLPFWKGEDPDSHLRARLKALLRRPSVLAAFDQNIEAILSTSVPTSFVTEGAGNIAAVSSGVEWCPPQAASR